jgi:5'-3' exonuclease
LLTGDTADGIPGIHGIGPKRAEKILRDIEDPFMMYVEVLRAYIKDTGIQEGESQEDYHKRVVLLVREHISLLYLLRKPGERFQVPEKREELVYDPRYGSKAEYRKYLKLIESAKIVTPQIVPYLSDPACFSKDCNFLYSSRINTAFVWGATEQGHDYWSNINDLLRKDAKDTAAI